MQTWLIDSLHDDGIYENSDFFEYVGNARNWENTVDLLFKQVIPGSYVETRLSEVADILANMHETRYKHFNYLSEHNRPLKISYFTTRKDIMSVDSTVEQLIREIESLANADTTSSITLTSKLTNFIKLLKNVEKRDMAFYRIANTLKEEQVANTESVEYIHVPFSVPQKPTHQFYANAPGANVYQQAPSTPTYPQQPFYPPQHPPVMRQAGPDCHSVKKMKRSRKSLKSKVVLSLATTACIIGLAALSGVSVPPVKPVNPHPVATEKPYTPEISTYGGSMSTDSLIINYTQAPIPTPQPTKAPEYKKGTLMHALENIDDELLAVIANSLQNSINGLGELQISMYGNGCNFHDGKSAREYVGEVFKILDTRATELHANGDRYALALQMEELSGDVSKYLIAKSMNEGGRYQRNNYTMKDIDFYSGGVTNGMVKKFTARTVTEKNGKMVQESLIGHTEHFSPLLRNLILNHCTLNAAIHGKTGDRCVIGTQEGTVIYSTSASIYNSLVSLLENEYEFTSKAPGKGIGVKSTIEIDDER